MSWTNAAVTEAGLALQAKLVDGQTLGFLRVAAGTGTVDPSVLANQTALANEKQTLTFQPPNVLDEAKIKVPVMLNNIGLESGYTMQQLGFFVEDPDNGEILYAIVQDEVGDTVPSQTESPGFVIEWAFVFQYGNAGSVTVTLDPVGLVSIGMVGQPNGVAGLDENGAVPVAQGGTGETTAPAALAALGAGVRDNELDNAYFAGGGTGWGVFPVNQRGVSGTISTPGYFIDRWKLVSGTVQITSAGLVLNGTIAQILPASIGSVYTATALTTTELVMCQYDDSSRTFIITGTGQTFVFAKLEKGLGQTAACQHTDKTWHLLPQPESDYATQLLKCQSYLLMGLLEAPHLTRGYAFLPTPVSMRTTPVILGTAKVFTCANNTLQPDATTVNMCITNGILFQYSGVDEACYVTFQPGSGLSCEL